MGKEMSKSITCFAQTPSSQYVDIYERKIPAQYVGTFSFCAFDYHSLHAVEHLAQTGFEIGLWV